MICLYFLPQRQSSFVHISYGRDKITADNEIRALPCLVMHHIQLDDAQHRMDANVAAETSSRITDVEAQCHWSWQKTLKHGRCWKFSVNTKLLYHDISHELNSALINCNEVQELSSCAGCDLLFVHVNGFKTLSQKDSVCACVCYVRQKCIADKTQSRCISIPIK